MHLIKTTRVAVFALISIAFICVRKIATGNTLSSNFPIPHIASPTFLKQFLKMADVSDKQSFMNGLDKDIEIVVETDEVSLEELE